MSLIPENNMERILNGEDVTPSCRAEYFVKQAIANASSDGGKTITVDSALSDTSENPVQNKVITAALAAAKPLIVNGTWAETESAITVDITNSGYTLADIYAAAQADRAVFLEYSEEGTTTRMNLATRAESNGEYELGFFICAIMSDKPAVVTVAFDNSLVGTFGIAVGQ